MRTLFAGIVLALTIAGWSSAPAEAAVIDVTGVWTVADAPSTKLLVEKQAGRTRIAIVSADAVGLDHAWYVGTSTSLLGTTTTVKVEALSFQRLFGRPGTSTKVVGTANLAVTLDDPFHGKLVVGGQSHDLERVALVANGLIAPLDPQAPETGWYDTGTGFAFLEGQGTHVFVTRLTSAGGKPAPANPTDYRKSGDRTWVRAGDAADVLKAPRITAPTRTSGSAAAEPFARVRLFTSTVAFAEDRTATAAGVDADGNGVRDDVDSVLFGKTLISSRVRDGLVEIAAAERAYMAAPTAATALAAYERIGIASACLTLLAPGEIGDARDLVDSLLYNTSQRAIALDQMPVVAGPRLIGMPAVSLSDPNLCAGFMQGVARRFDTISTGALRKAALAPKTSIVEGEIGARRASTPAAQTTVKTCAATQILLVTGVSTDQTLAETAQLPVLEGVLRANGIDRGKFGYGAFADQNPGFVNDVAQVLVRRLGVTERQADDLARSGFKYMFEGLVKVVFDETPAGFVGGGLTITRGVLQVAAGIIAKNAILENARDLQMILGLLVANHDAYVRTVAVAHSRGNLRMNDAYRAAGADVRRSAAIASIANPDTGVADGSSGATRDDDRVMLAVRTMLGAEAPTIFGAGDPKDWWRHGLIDSYLHNPTALAAILPRIRTALVRAKIPSGGTQRVLATSSGGYTGGVAQTATYDIGANGVSFTLDYQAYSIPDRFDVIYRGRILASTGGPVSGGGTLTVPLPRDANDPSDGRVVIAVYGPDPGTAWDYRVICPTGN